MDRIDNLNRAQQHEHECDMKLGLKMVWAYKELA